VQNRTHTRLILACLSLLGCGTHPVNVGTVTDETGDPGNGGTSDGTGVYTFVDYGSTDVEKVVAPIACDGSNSAAVSALFKYAPGYAPDPSVKAKVQSTLASMSLRDEATQMRGMSPGVAGQAQMNDIQRSPDAGKIRGFHFRDGPHGMNLQEDMNGSKPNAATVNGIKVGYATSFPAGVARGAAFDLDLEYAIGEAIGDEMQAAKETVLLAPFVDLVRSPLWGRAQESYGEDPFHAGRLGSAMTVGIQQHVAAAAVHYTGYDIEIGRSQNNTVMDEQTLREIYGRQYRMVAQDGGVAGMMTSYNLVNGIKTTRNAHLLSDVLRADFGFQGFVLSDWWAFTTPGSLGTDSTDLMRLAIEGVRAGLDIEMPWSLSYAQLETAVKTGALTKADLDASAGRILEQKFRFNADSMGSVGLGTPRTAYKNGRVLNNGEHINLARIAALESMVLLKNDGATLPITPALRKVAVLGADLPYVILGDSLSRKGHINFATDVAPGDLGTNGVYPDPAKTVGPFAGIQKAAPDGVTVVLGSNAGDAVDADFVVVVAGLTPEDEGEEFTLGGDRMSLALDAKQTDPALVNIQNNLIASVAALGKPMVVVLEGGGVIDMPWLDQVPAVVMAWYPGMVGGEALGQLLWGQANFSGKLPITWSRLSDYPVLRSDDGATSASYFVGYRYFDRNTIAPLYPLGYGLSYTSFEYRKLQLGCTDLSRGAVLPVLVNVANTGTVAGDETVMVFVSFPDSAAPRRPVKELKGFVRVRLDPGQEKQVVVPIRLQDLDYFATDVANPATGAWRVESGHVDIMVGGSSASLPLKARVAVNGY
jgi:beta-glucosidase